jgi:hypothetical protein
MQQLRQDLLLDMNLRSTDLLPWEPGYENQPPASALPRTEIKHFVMIWDLPDMPAKEQAIYRELAKIYEELPPSWYINREDPGVLSDNSEGGSGGEDSGDGTDSDNNNEGMPNGGQNSTNAQSSNYQSPYLESPVTTPTEESPPSSRSSSPIDSISSRSSASSSPSEPATHSANSVASRSPSPSRSFKPSRQMQRLWNSEPLFESDAVLFPSDTLPPWVDPHRPTSLDWFEERHIRDAERQAWVKCQTSDPPSPSSSPSSKMPLPVWVDPHRPTSVYPLEERRIRSKERLVWLESQNMSIELERGYQKKKRAELAEAKAQKKAERLAKEVALAEQTKAQTQSEEDLIWNGKEWDWNLERLERQYQEKKRLEREEAEAAALTAQTKTETQSKEYWVWNGKEWGWDIERLERQYQEKKRLEREEAAAAEREKAGDVGPMKRRKFSTTKKQVAAVSKEAINLRAWTQKVFHYLLLIPLFVVFIAAWSILIAHSAGYREVYFEPPALPPRPVTLQQWDTTYCEGTFDFDTGKVVTKGVCNNPEFMGTLERHFDKEKRYSGDTYEAWKKKSWWQRMRSG